MASGDPIRGLRDFIDERWAAIQPRRYADVAEPSVRLDVTAREAEWFLISVGCVGHEPPLFEVDNDDRVRSDRIPPNVGGTPRASVFFEEHGRLRLETIVHMAAVARLRDEFGWPREHLVVESPDVVDDDGRDVLRREAIDILLLQRPCFRLPSKMTLAAARSRVAVEAKADKRVFDRLLKGMHACPGEGDGEHGRSDHNKCRAVEVFRPQFVLGVAAGETWRLSSVDESDGRAVLGEPRDLDCLYFDR